MASPNVAVVSDSLATQQAFANVLGQCGLTAIVASTASEAEAIVKYHPISLIFCSDELPGGGIDRLIRHCSQPSNNVPVIVVSRLDDWEWTPKAPGRYTLASRAADSTGNTQPDEGVCNPGGYLWNRIERQDYSVGTAE